MTCKVITIGQQKGGAGKTTVAAHLAIALSQKGQRVAVIDIDPQGSLTRWHKLREDRFGEGFTGLTFAALSGWRVGSEISRMRKSHDFIIIDSPPHTETEARTAIRNADMVLIPVQPSPTDVWATQATLDLAKSDRVPVKVVMNRVAANSKLAQKFAKELTDLTKATLGNRVAFASSLMEGRCATEIDPSSPASEEVKMLVKEILAIFPREDDDAKEAATPKTRKKAKELVDA